MKLIFPITDSSVYNNDDEYLKVWFRSQKEYFNEVLKVNGVVFVKDVLTAFGININGLALGTLAQAWISPLRVGMKNTHDRRYKVKIHLKLNRPESRLFRAQYCIEMNINDKPRKRTGRKNLISTVDRYAKDMYNQILKEESKGGKKHG